MNETCSRCGGRGWLAARDARTAHMRGKPTLRACPDCNRVDSEQLERAAKRAQEDLQRMVRRAPDSVTAVAPGDSAPERPGHDGGAGGPDADDS